VLQNWARARAARGIMQQLMGYRDVVNGAATKIECMARARRARKRAAVLRRIRRVDEANARTRRHEARCRFRMESHGAALKAQRVFRSYLARRNFRQGVLFAKRYMNATKIAKTFRMYVVRLEYLDRLAETRPAMVQIDRVARGFLARLHVRGIYAKKEEARQVRLAEKARILGQNYRVNAMRMNFMRAVNPWEKKKQKSAALDIQRVFRGWGGRKRAVRRFRGRRNRIRKKRRHVETHTQHNTTQAFFPRLIADR